MIGTAFCWSEMSSAMFCLFATHHLVAPCHGHALEFDDFAARGCQQILGFA